jgi:hypothetical protein
MLLRIEMRLTEQGFVTKPGIPASPTDLEGFSLLMALQISRGIIITLNINNNVNNINNNNNNNNNFNSSLTQRPMFIYLQRKGKFKTNTSNITSNNNNNKFNTYC